MTEIMATIFKDLNRESNPTYRRSLKEQLLSVLTTNTLSNTFYVSKQEICQETLEVMCQAAREIPEFMAKALVYARNEGFLKLAPTVGLVALSTARDKTHFQKAFDRVILIPDDLRTFVSLCRRGLITGRKGFGGCVVQPVKDWLNRMSQYHAVKYGSGQSKDITLADIIRMSHPKPVQRAVEERFGWLIKGWPDIGLEPSPTNPMIWGLEKLKRGYASEEEMISLIEKYNLPFEVVVPSVSKVSTRIWEKLMRKAPYLNLLRNLNTFQRHGVFENEESLWYAVERLTNLEAIGHSKVLPFRFFDAWRAYTNDESRISLIADALEEALNKSFVNMPSLNSLTVALGIDTSASMDGLVSDKGTTRYIDIAGIFTAALLKKIEGRAIPLPFDTRVHPEVCLSGRDSFMTITSKIDGLCGGSTAIGSPVEYLLDRKVKMDIFIGITDHEEWAYGAGYACRYGFLEAWREYKRKVNPDAKAFLVTIAPYRDAVSSQDEPDVYFIYGWSEAVLKYISLQIESGESQISAVEKIEL